MASIIEKNINDLLSGLHHGLGVSEYADQKGWLQRLDPRTKVAAVLLLLIYANLSQSVTYLILVYLACLVVCVMSMVPIRSMLKIWIVLPFFSLIFAVPMIFSFVTPGATLLHIPGISSVTITWEGVLFATRFLIRIGLSVTFVQMILATTPWNRTLSAFRFFRIPAGILFILSLTYRYIFVLVGNALDMILARKSRTAGKVTGSDTRMWFGTLIGTLMIKSFVLSREVNDAMVSRGFTGQIRTLEVSSFGSVDYVGWLMIIGVGIICVTMRRIV